MGRTTTTRLGLSKPDANEPYDVSIEHGSNLDKIDSAISFTECTNATRPTGADAWDGRGIIESDTGKAYVREDGNWRQVAVSTGSTMPIDGNVSISGTLATGNSDADMQRFTANGTWTKPSGAKTVWVRCWGGGGAGGGAAATAAGQAACGNGGQAGGYAESWHAASDLSATEAVAVGGGGTGSTGAGPDGNPTTFAAGTGEEVAAAGGNGGAILAASATFGVTNPDDTAQTNTGNTVTARGEPGSWGIRNGPDGAGAGGNGGGAGGGAGRGNNTGQNGEANSGGGGGGAGNNASQTAKNGGNGGSGLCVVVSFFD
jgi:hypothetical protein